MKLSDDTTADLTVKSIGGIDTCSITMQKGTTLLTGQNATNRTSLLTALNGVLGGTQATVNSDEDTGQVELVLNTDTESHTYSRTYSRTAAGTTTKHADTLSDDAELVDTFVTLLETNDARQAVQTNSAVRDVLMRPVDTNAIERELGEKKRERNALQSELKEIEQLIDREPELVEQRERYTTELEEIRSEINELETEVEQYEADAEMAEEAEHLLAELEQQRETTRDIETDIERYENERETLANKERELIGEIIDLYEKITGESVGVAVEDIDTVSETINLDAITDEERISELETEKTQLRERKSQLTETIEGLQRIISFNKSTLSDTDSLPGIEPDTTDTTQTAADLTAQLNPSAADTDQIKCWTCGSVVGTDVVTARTSELTEFVSDRRDDRADAESRLEEIRTELARIRDTEREREQLTKELDATRSKQNRVESRIEDAAETLDVEREKLHDLQTQVEETEDLRESDILDVYEDLNKLEYKRGQIETSLDDVDEKLNETESAREQRDTIEETIEDLREDIESLRTRIADIERDIVEEFNRQMSHLLDLLAYENITRVWIERKVPDTGSQTSEFELHVVRESDGGGAYEDTIDHLSESEREVIGIVVAFAGYLVHDVADEVPFLIIDSVEAFDANRLVDLVEYISDATEFCTVALLPEDAAAFSDDYDRVTADQLAPTTPTST